MSLATVHRRLYGLSRQSSGLGAWTEKHRSVEMMAKGLAVHIGMPVDIILQSPDVDERPLKVV